MAARAYWSGYLRLSLLQVPVDMFTATESGKNIQFHKIHKPTGKRVHYQNIVEELGPVDRRDIISGYEFEKGKYVTLQPKELEAIKLESKKNIDILQFVDAHEIDAIYYDQPYFLVPKDEQGEEAYRVVRDALKQTKKVGVGQVVIGGKERLVAIKPCGRGLLLETLRYADQVRKASSYFREIDSEAIEDERIELAKELIERKAAAFDPAKFEDHYRLALRQLIETKLQGRTPPREEAPSVPKAQMFDIMEALKKSLGEPATRKKPAAAKPRSPARKKPAKTARTKPATRKSPRHAA